MNAKASSIAVVTHNVLSTASQWDDSLPFANRLSNEESMVVEAARDLHDGNGISDEYHMIRHAMNLERPSPRT